jgi:uncharacterized membrane protein YbjE (DUF340 family)
MIFTLDIYTLLKVLAVLQGLIFTILLTRRAWMQERYSDYWLAALLFIFSAYLFRYVVDDMEPNDDNNILKRILPISYYVIGVVIYFYLKCQLNARYRLSRRDLWHFLPVFVYILLFFIKIIQTYKHGSTWERPYIFQIILVVFIVYRSIGTAIYWFLSWRLYQKYRLWLPTERSDMEGVKCNNNHNIHSCTR